MSATSGFILTIGGMAVGLTGQEHSGEGNQGTSSGTGGANSNNSYSSSRTGDMDIRGYGQPRVRDLPTKRNLNQEFTYSADSRTGGNKQTEKGEVMSPHKGGSRGDPPREHDLRHDMEQKREQNQCNKLYAHQGQREGSLNRECERKGKHNTSNDYVNRFG